MSTLRRAAAATMLLVAASAAGWASIASAQSGPTRLVGTFRLTPGSCTDAGVEGTYLRLIVPTGNENGPYVANGDSPCSEESFTPLEPGTDGGLVSGGHQPAPDPVFDGNGNGLSDRITQPTSFFGVQFSTSTNPVDPQTGLEAPAPTILVEGTTLTGQTQAFAAHWNNQDFNQGAPKPDGSQPGLTSPPSGRYDPGTGAFVLDWRSHIQGGPFNGFTGVWHLEGVFVPAENPATPPSTSRPNSASGATSTTVDDPPPDDATSTTTPTPASPDSTQPTSSAQSPLDPADEESSGDEDRDDLEDAAARPPDDDEDAPVLPAIVAGLAIVGVTGTGTRWVLGQRGAP